MADKMRQSGSENATQVFRQFAWNLAGTLAKTKTTKPAPRRTATRRTTAKRAPAK